MRGRILGALAFILVFSAIAEAQTLTWDPNSEPDISGYVVSVGTQSGVYSSNVDVGGQTSYPLTTLDPTQNYYFAVRAYNSEGLFSAYSREIALPAIAPPGTTVINFLRASTTYPLLAGRQVTWTASATSKKGSVEYAFWLYSASGWVKAQDYSSNASFTWAPAWNDRGVHAVQLWARTVGSPAKYEAWVGTDLFTVATQPLQLTSSVEFPVPPGQTITWSASMASVPSGVQLEYEYWLYQQSTGGWSIVQPYGPQTDFTWTPTATGTYALQVWARQVGSTSNYDVYAGSGYFAIAKGPVVVKSLTADTILPSATGTTITWTAKARGGSAGPLQYSFWRYRDGSGWTEVQPYSPTNTYTWTPTWGDEGKYALQVWVRSADSTAKYETWLGTGMFEITRASVQIVSNVTFPAAPGTSVTWTASVSDTSSPVEYAFWVYNQGTGTWTNPQTYGSGSTFTWTPAAGRYAVQVWVRRSGTTAKYDAWRGTDILTVAPSAAKVLSLNTTSTLPATSGNSMTWTAMATGGIAGPLQYEFWVFDGTSWQIGQGYSSSNTFTFAPTSPGKYALQVWVRSAGSASNYEAWLGSGDFVVQ
jgi:hypothetical protein